MGNAQCTFPTDLRGSWISADRGTLTGTTAVTVFGTITLRAHICLEFYNLNSEKYYYHVATALDPASNDRIHVSAGASTVTHSDVCNRRTPFEVETYVMLIKDGASDASLAVKCPSDILRKFENVQFSSADGTASCSGKLDTCTDKLKMNYAYNSCSNSLTFSADGLWRCLYYTYSGSTTYLAALNMDTTLVSYQTNRIVCYTLQWHDDILNATAHPGSCLPDQTSSSVVSPGVLLTMSDSSDPEPEHGFDLVPFYVGAIALALLIIGCIGVCVNYRHYKNADKPNRVHTIKEKEMDDIYKRESTTTSDIFSYTYVGLKHLKKTANVKTAEDFYRNQKMYVDKGLLPRKVLQGKLHKPQKGQRARKQNVALTVNQNMPYVENNIHENKLIKFSERQNIYGQGRKPTKTTADPGVNDEGDIPNTVHYFNRIIPMHWK
ncbi:unnamed protein product [Mytilus edulis]|uniref:DUF7042 domain-containing protein n=1 Tax=Mytilus edulis TaxID=6550 RepID=A0A8S3SBG6_MYTED|nr:unnamed protein product [Mytilus edulis]